MNKHKILLVDNKKSHQDTVREFLKLRGYEIFVANDPQAAKDLAEAVKPDLAVIDLRLRDDMDSGDFSGLALAKELPSQLPKIMWTIYPTYQAVREALGSTLNEVPPAVGFVAKQEGLPKLLNTIQLALAKLSPTFETNLLQEFNAPGLLALPEMIETLGPRNTISHLRSVAEKTATELTELRKAALSQAERQQQLSLWARIFGIAMLVATVSLLLFGKIEAGLASTVVSLLSEFLRAHFIKLEKQAYLRADRLHEDLRDAEKDQHLMLLVEALENQADRDEYRKKVMDHILRRRSD